MDNTTLISSAFSAQILLALLLFLVLTTKTIKKEWEHFILIKEEFVSFVFTWKWIIQPLNFNGHWASKAKRREDVLILHF